MRRTRSRRIRCQPILPPRETETQTIVIDLPYNQFTHQSPWQEDAKIEREAQKIHPQFGALGEVAIGVDEIRGYVEECGSTEGY